MTACNVCRQDKPRESFSADRRRKDGRDEHAEAGERWAERTRAAVLEAGVWPNRLPRWGGERGPEKKETPHRGGRSRSCV